MFNSITAVEQYRGKEMNPFVNPGAIATVGKVKGSSPDEVWNKILGIHSDFAGRQLEVNQEVYKSEGDTNQRNRAISALMSAYERFPMDPAVAVDLYTRAMLDQRVGAGPRRDGRDAGHSAARNPVTGKQVIDRSHVPGLLAVMATAGMYDDSGKWLFQHRPAGQERRRRRPYRGLARQVRHRHLLAAAGRRRQQRPRPAGDHRHRQRAERQSLRPVRLTRRLSAAHCVARSCCWPALARRAARQRRAADDRTVSSMTRIST